MKKEFVSILVLLTLLIPSQVLFFKGGIYPSQDALYHIGRIDQFHQAVTFGQIPPRIAPTLLDGIGYPLFIANYQLPFYFTEIFMQLTGNAVFAFKSVMAISYLLSVVFMYLVFRQLTNRFESISGSIIFGYLPFRFANIYSRAALGESVSAMFIPLALLSLHFIAADKKWGTVVLAIALFGLLTSHPVIFALFLPFFVLYYSIFLKSSNKNVFKLLFAFILGLALAAFQIIPMVFERSYMKFDAGYIGVYPNHLLDPAQIFRIPLSGVNISSPFQAGLISLVIVIFAVYSIFWSKRKKELLFFSFIFFVSVFLSSKFSKSVWDSLIFLRYIVFPWRFLWLATVSVSYLVVYTFRNFRHRNALFALVIFLAMYSSRHYYLKPTQFESSQPTANLTTQNEFDPVWSNGESFKKRDFIQTGNHTLVSNVVYTPYLLSFGLNTKSRTEVLIRKLYFPGWYLFINDDSYPIKIKNGLIAFDAPDGISDIVLKYKGTRLEYFSNLLTLFAFAVLIVFVAKFSLLKRIK